MGNSLGGKKSTKVMKIDGETLKLKTPIKAGDVLKDHPGLVLLESEEVKHYGVRAKALEAHKELQPKRLYFLVELPKESLVGRRRVHSSSGINMSAKDRLESLFLSRRSASDLTIMKQQQQQQQQQQREQDSYKIDEDDGIGGMRLKMRLPKSQVEKLMKSSNDDAEVAERIMGLCMENGSNEVMKHEFMHWKGSRARLAEFKKANEHLQKRVSFMPINEGGNPIAVASH